MRQYWLDRRPGRLTITKSADVHCPPSVAGAPDHLSPTLHVWPTLASGHEHPVHRRAGDASRLDVAE